MCTITKFSVFFNLKILSRYLNISSMQMFDISHIYIKKCGVHKHAWSANDANKYGMYKYLKNKEPIKYIICILKRSLV